MSERDENRQPVTRGLALVALEALANYKTSGLVQPGETMHLDLATRLARLATQVNKEG